MRHICYKFVDCQGSVKAYLKNILFLSCTSLTLPIPSEAWLWVAVHGWLLKGHFHGMVYIMSVDFYLSLGRKIPASIVGANRSEQKA